MKYCLYKVEFCSILSLFYLFYPYYRLLLCFSIRESVWRKDLLTTVCFRLACSALGLSILRKIHISDLRLVVYTFCGLIILTENEVTDFEFVICTRLLWQLRRKKNRKWNLLLTESYARQQQLRLTIVFVVPIIRSVGAVHFVRGRLSPFGIRQPKILCPPIDYLTKSYILMSI